jgi:methionyl-tRNA synthetase
MTTYVTTPIYYPNDVPHIGTAYPTLAADVVARWSRLRGDDTLFLTGTDEHGKKIENAALKIGITPQQFVDVLSNEFVGSFQKIGISYDRFIRTTDTDHAEVVQEILRRLNGRGDIYKGTYEGLYCVECEAYYTLEDLVDGLCPLHRRSVEVLSEDCYYFRLSHYRNWLLKYYEDHPSFILPPSRYKEVVTFVRGGLDDLCISRSSFKWGIPIPFDNDHITYVWFDALLNYITGVGYLNRPHDFEKFWPTTTHIIGKDILRFHAVIWPAILQSAGISPPKRIFAHGFWQINGQKFSKSLRNTVLLGDLIDRHGLDPLRYYIFRECPFGEDGNFSEENLVQRNNSELAKGLGNLVHRATGMIVKYCGGTVPAYSFQETLDVELESASKVALNEVSDAIEDLAFNKALEIIWKYISHVNAYINARRPWILANKGETARLELTLAHLAESMRFLSTLTAPFMPETGLAIAKQLGLNNVPQVDQLTWGRSLSGAKVHSGPRLFQVLSSFTHSSSLAEKARDTSVPFNNV